MCNGVRTRDLGSGCCDKMFFQVSCDVFYVVATTEIYAEERK